MTRTAFTIAAVGAALLSLALAVGLLAPEERARDPRPSPADDPAPPAARGARPGTQSDAGFIHGRITTVDGAILEGRLRWGGGQEAFWGDYFNGTKLDNPWIDLVPPGRRPSIDRPLEIFGFQIGTRERSIDLGRPFMARFGDIARIETRGLGEVRVTLKSGAVVTLNRFDAGDIDDGVEVSTRDGAIVSLDTLRIRTIELLPGSASRPAPYRLHGTVRTARGEFTGFVQWDREECVGTDELEGRSAEGGLALRFDSIDSIARRSIEGVVVTLLDGSELVLTDTQDVDRGNRGIYVDDPRYGRVLVSWEAFERLGLHDGGSGPGYDAFPPGGPLMGSVTTRAGDRFTGRLVYDLDESETTETLDAPFQGVDYTIPFGLVAAIVLPGGDDPVRVDLHTGEELQLELEGDLGGRNAGLLILGDEGLRSEYVAWSDVGRIDLDRPPAMYPPLRD